MDKYEIDASLCIREQFQNCFSEQEKLFQEGQQKINDTGLFANVTGEIRNLDMKSVNISYGRTYTGAIAGINSGNITKCSVSGSIAKGYYVGGIAGKNTGTISLCYNTADISGTYYVGGIVGYNLEATIMDCYNTGSINNTENSSDKYASGIVGFNKGSSSSKTAQIQRCYNLGNITSKYSSSYAFAIAKNYSSYSYVSNSYYLNGVGVGITGATSLTEAQTQLQSMYSGFDFENVWLLNTNAIYTYPQLRLNAQDDRDLESAKIATLPDKLVYQKEQLLDMSGCTLEFTYTNADDEIVVVTNDMVTGYDKDVVGEQTLTISYNLRTFEFTVTVEEKPFKEIYTVLDLYNIRYDLNSNYILMNDIDLTSATAEGGEWNYDGRGWNPIGSEDIYSNSAFSGIFDGNGYSIIGMRIHAYPVPDGAPSSTYTGLFAYVTGEVRNLDMKDVNISYGRTYAGAIAGRSSGKITNCSVSGNIAKGYYAGGIVGENDGTVTYSYNTANVSGSYYVGGITGYNYEANIADCYNTGAINNTDNYSDRYASGIAGFNKGSLSGTATIYRCYNLGKTTAKYSSTYAKAIAGNYSAYSKVYDSYYLTDTGVGVTGATALVESQMKLSSVYEGFDFEKTWYLSSTANYPYPQLINNNQDIREISEAKIYTLPNNLIYTKGESLNVEGFVLEFKFSNADTEYVTVTSDMIEGFDSTKLGIQTLSVTYYRKTFTFDVTVNEKPFIKIYTVKGLYDIRNDLSANYILMNDIDLTAATLDGGEWDFGGRGWNPIGSEDIYSNSAFSGIFDGNGFSIIGNHPYPQLKSNIQDLNETVTLIRVIAYPAKMDYLTGDELNMVGGMFEAIYISGKTDVIVGEELDLTGMVVVASYETGELVIIGDYTVSGFDGTAGSKVITVTHKGKSASFTVNVAVIAVEKLTLTKLPVKLAYIENEPLNTEGLIVTATYNDGTVKNVTDYDVVGFSSLPGVHTLYVVFGGQVASFQINVSAKVLSDVRVVLPNKTTFNIGDEFDTTGMQVIACYNNGQEHIVDSYTMTGFDSLSAGAKEIVITYGGFTRSFAVAVVKKVELKPMVQSRLAH